MSKEFKVAATQARRDFWANNCEKMAANPAIAKHIDQIKLRIEEAQWNALEPEAKLKELYCKMVQELKDLDPDALSKLDPKN